MTQSPLIPSMMSSLSLSSLSPSLLVSALPLTIKLIISQHDIRRITIPTSVVSPYTYLISLIVNHNAQSYFTYQDDEGDTITVRTDDDLREAFRITSGRTLRLTYHGTSHSHNHAMHHYDDEGDDAAAEAEESFIYVDDDAGAGGSPHAGIAMPVQVPAPTPAAAPAARPQQVQLGEMSPTVPGETHEGYRWVEEGKAARTPTAEGGVRLTPHHRHVPSAILSVNIPTPSKPSLPSSSSMPFDVYRSLASLPERDGLAAAASPKRPPPPPFLPILHRQCMATVKQAEDLYHTLYHECEETKRRLKHEMNAKMNTDSIEENNKLLEMYAKDKAALEEKLQKNLSALLLRYEAYVGSFPNFTFLNPIYVHIGIHGRPNVRLETAVSPVSCLTGVVQQLQKYLTSIGERPYLHGSVIKCTLQKPNPHRTECDFELEDVTILLGDMHLPIGTRLTFYEDITLVDAHYQAMAKEEETHPLIPMSSASSSVAVSPAISPSNVMNVVTSNPSSPTFHAAPHPTFSLSSFAAGIMSLSTANSQLSAARSPALRSFSPVLPIRRHSSINDEKTRTPSTSSTERPRNFIMMNPDYQPKTARTLFTSSHEDVRMSRAASMPVECKSSIPPLPHATSTPTGTGEADHPEPESQSTQDDESVDGCDHSHADAHIDECDVEEHKRSPSLTPGRMLVDEKHDVIPVDASQLYDLSPSSMLIVPESNDLTASIADMKTLSLETTITPLDASGVTVTPLNNAIITPLDASTTPLDASVSITPSVDSSMMASAVTVTPMEASALGGSHVWIDPTKSIELP